MYMVFAFNLVNEFVVDFVFGVAGVGGVFLELGSEIGAYLHGIGVGEGLEDLGEEDVIIAEEL